MIQTFYEKKYYVALKPANNKVFYENKIYEGIIDFRPTYHVKARKLLREKNIFLNTIDIKTPIPAILDIYLDTPYFFEIKHWLRVFFHRKKSILFIWEPSLVNPFNFMKLFQMPFAKIYTWNEELVDNKKYFLMRIPKMSDGIHTKKVPFQKKKLLLLMNSNWLPFRPFEILAHTKELYTKRIEAIEFFEKKCPEEFDLWGRGWNRPHKYSISQHIFGYKKFKSYRGSFPYKNKISIISRYKFSLCFENCQENGYVSEKISECLKAKCVPVYWGAPNIKDIIPKGTYIDFRDFETYEELYLFLSSMKEPEYNRYIRNIEHVIKDKDFLGRWYEKGFARVFLNIVEEYL